MKKRDSGYKIKTSLEFRTDKETKGKRRFTTGLFILIGIVMLASVCTLLLLKEYDFDIDNIIGRSPETTESESGTQAEMELEGKTVFLVAASDNDGKKLHHAALVSADVASGEMKIYTLDVKKDYSGKGVSGSLNSVFSRSDGSMLSFKEAVLKVTGEEASRYIRATDSSFKSLVKTFGGVPYDVKERVSYSCEGVGYIIEKGNQTLTADMSYKLMYYLSQQNGNKPEEMSAFLSALFKTVLTGQNFTKADYYYSKLRNILDTDISAFDFSDSTASVQQFIQLFSEKEPEIVRSPDEL